MKLATFLRFFRQLKGKKPVNIDAIQSMGLLAVKLGQIFALRPDLIEPERCIELQQLYSRAATIPEENSQALLKKFAPEGFMDHFEFIEPVPFAAASIGQIHRAKLKDGSKVVVKIIKSDFEASFQRDVKRMKRWIRMGLFFNPRLRKVGNPIGLLAHIEDYTLRELNLLNEIEGRMLLHLSYLSLVTPFVPFPQSTAYHPGLILPCLFSMCFDAIILPASSRSPPSMEYTRSNPFKQNACVISSGLFAPVLDIDPSLHFTQIYLLYCPVFTPTAPVLAPVTALLSTHGKHPGGLLCKRSSACTCCGSSSTPPWALRGAAP